jgi:hypothetical protein
MIKGITYILKTDTTFQTRVGQNVALSKYKAYPVIAPQTESVPYSVCRMTAKALQYKGRSTYLCEFQVASYNKNYDDLEELEDAVIEALVPRRGTYNGIDFNYIEFTNSSDDYVEAYSGLYVRITSFSCSINKTALT